MVTGAAGRGRDSAKATIPMTRTKIVPAMNNGVPRRRMPRENAVRMLPIGSPAEGNSGSSTTDEGGLLQGVCRGLRTGPGTTLAGIWHRRTFAVVRQKPVPDSQPGGRMRLKCGILAALLLGLVSAPASAQTRTITGSVRDSLTGAPIAGARIGVQGGTTAVSPNAAGQFELTGVPAGEVTLQV